MEYRNIIRQTEGSEMKVGPLKVKQPLPAKGLDQVSPFILLHHAGPQLYAARSPRTRLNPHPHRGFEPVTFLFSGKLHHRDSMGNEGFLEGGDVQWMTAGSGLIHSEGPSEAFAREGGEMELIQLWVNLPRDQKMTPPKYQDIKSKSIPEWTDGGVKYRLVAGTYDDKKGPAQTFSPITALIVEMKKGSSATIPVPPSYNALAYVLSGEVKSGETVTQATQLSMFDLGGEAVFFTALEDTRILFLAGEPIHEPLVSYGPFVMNYPGEIKQAILDYETGRMGVLDS